MSPKFISPDPMSSLTSRFLTFNCLPNFYLDISIISNLSSKIRISDFPSKTTFYSSSPQFRNYHNHPISQNKILGTIFDFPSQLTTKPPGKFHRQSLPNISQFYQPLPGYNVTILASPLSLPWIAEIPTFYLNVVWIDGTHVWTTNYIKICIPLVFSLAHSYPYFSQVTTF